MKANDAKTGTSKKAAGTKKGSTGFTAEEKAAMKERTRELRKEKRGGAGEDEEGEVLARIGELPAGERALAERLHRVIRSVAPELAPRTWYGMPAYARGGKVVCFFQSAAKFKTRYATLGFSDQALLDEGTLWPTAYALTKMGADEEAKVKALLLKALGR